MKIFKNRLRIGLLLSPVFAGINLWVLMLVFAVSKQPDVWLYKMTGFALGFALAEGYLVAMVIAEVVRLVRENKA